MSEAVAPFEATVQAPLAEEIVCVFGRQERMVEVASPTWTETCRSPGRLGVVNRLTDILAAIALMLVLGVGHWFANQILPPAGSGIVTALLAWVLAEVFTRSRRRVLAGVVLLFAFAYGTLAALAAILGVEVGHPLELLLAPVTAPLAILSPKLADGGALALACTMTAMIVGLHYWRFRVPVTVAATAAAVIGTASGFVAALAPEVFAAHRDLLLMAAGSAVLALAMRYDLADSARITRMADVAFWLYLLAAPLIVHAALVGFVGSDRPVEADTAAALLGAFLLLSAVAVAFDRRSLLVSGFVYAGITFGLLTKQAGVAGSAVPLALVALGAVLLLPGASWSPLRRALLNLLPSAAVSRLPHSTGPR